MLCLLMIGINLKEVNSNIKSQFTIVFLHEGLGCIQSWKDYPEKICKVLKVRGIVYDRSGYGKSKGSLANRTNDYLIEAAKDLNQIIENLDLQKVILYGHSDGGSIALSYAAMYPKDLVCIVTEAAHVLNEPITIEGIKKAVVAFENGKLNGLAKWHGKRYKKVFYAWSKTWLRESFDLSPLKSILSRIQVDQLIIQGKKDQYGTINQVKTIKKHTQGKTKVLMPNCGHAPFLECENEVLLASTHFIKSQINAYS